MRRVPERGGDFKEPQGGKAGSHNAMCPAGRQVTPATGFSLASSAQHASCTRDSVSAYHHTNRHSASSYQQVEKG